MTEQEKDLLLKDLCARLPYGAIVKNKYSGISYKFNSIIKEEKTGKWIIDGVAYLDEVDIYLRPMSSMTEDEFNEFFQLDTVLDTVLEIGRLQIYGKFKAKLTLAQAFFRKKSKGN